MLGFLRLFRTELGRDFGARKNTGKIRAGAPARTVAPAMMAMSLMFFIYMFLPFGLLHADNSRVSGARIWDQSPTPPCIASDNAAVGAEIMNVHRLTVKPDFNACQMLTNLMMAVAEATSCL